MKRPHQVIVPLLLPVALVSVIGLRFVVGETQQPMSAVAWAQTASSCGNAILDPGEQCDPPGSATCPSGFNACSAACTCQALDHFQCYEVKPGAFASTSVTGKDHFGTLVETLRFPHSLCNPTNKNGEGIVDPTDHLVGYQTKSPKFIKQTNKTFVDQFGTLKLDLVRPQFLLVPSDKDGVSQVPPLD